MQFRNITIENEIRIRGDATQWLGEATLRDGTKAYEINDGETVFGMGFRSEIQRATQTVGVENTIVDRVTDKRSTPYVQVKGVQNTMPENPIEYTGLQHSEAVIRTAFGGDNLSSSKSVIDHIKPALEILRRRSPSALILTHSDDRAKRWIKALKASGRNVAPVAAKKTGVYDFISVSTVSDYLCELGGNPHVWDALNLDPGMLIVDQCELIPAHELKRAARSIRPAFRLGFMETPPKDVSAMQRICHEMGPWVLGRPRNSHEFRWNSPL